jgi:DNA-binding CsgD family transcriptional regulator
MTKQSSQPESQVTGEPDAIDGACAAGNPTGAAAPRRRPAHFEVDDFTAQQRRITRRLRHGDGPKQIACAMGLGVRTVYWHQENIYARTGSHSLGEFFAWAYRHRDCCGYAELLDARTA